jgi:ribonuclease BN (tRNA processing enzyme)
MNDYMKLITGIFLSALMPVTYAQSCPEQGDWLQVLGSGGPEVQDKRASTSYLLWLDGKARVLIDAGGGSALRFGQSGAQMSTLDAVVFSHFHIDHSGDFPALVKSSFFENRSAPLPVFGPEGNRLLPSTSDFLDRLFSDNGVWPYLGHFLLGQRHFSYELQPHNVNFKSDDVIDVFNNERIKLSAIRVHHGPLPALAWRIDITDGSSITFSGDMSGEFGLLPKLARGSDVLVAHNAIAEGSTGVPRFLHMPPSVIGDLAATSEVNTLVLSHFMLRSLPVKSQTRKIIAAKYDGQIIFSNDLECVALKQRSNKNNTPGSDKSEQ